MDSIMVTTGSGFDGFRVMNYFGVISKEIVLINSLEKYTQSVLSDQSDSGGPAMVELKRVERTIENAKQYLIKQAEEEALRRGANALIGVAFGSSCGNDLLQVSLTGTAVKINKEADQNEIIKAGDTEKLHDKAHTIDIIESNVLSPFIPSAIVWEYVDGAFMVSLAAYLRMERIYGDIEADLTFINRFDDEYTVNNCCFLNFVCTQGSRIISAGYPVSIPPHILCCLKYCRIVVRKYMHEGKIHTVSEKQMSDVAAELRVFLSYSRKSIYWIVNELGNYNTAREMLDYFKSIENSVPEAYRGDLEKCLRRMEEVERLYGVHKKSTMENIEKLFQKYT